MGWKEAGEFFPEENDSKDILFISGEPWNKTGKRAIHAFRKGEDAFITVEGRGPNGAIIYSPKTKINTSPVFGEIRILYAPDSGMIEVRPGGRSKAIYAAPAEIPELNPSPGTVTVLPKIYQYLEILKALDRPVLMMPYFFKSMANQAKPGTPGKTPEYKEGDREYIAERFSAEVHGNAVRLLSDIGYYEPETIPFLGDFFLRDGAGKFDTKGKNVNPDWLEIFDQTGDEWIKRGVFPFFCFLNGSTLHGGDRGWAYHPANPENNNGVWVPEIGDYYPTHYDVRAWHGHCFQWDHFGIEFKTEIFNKGDWPQVAGKSTLMNDPAFAQATYAHFGCADYDEFHEYQKTNFDDVTPYIEAQGYTEDNLAPHQWDDMRRCQATREILVWHLNYLISRAEARWPGKFGVNHNEWPAGADTHLGKLFPIYEALGIGKNRILVSFAFEDWYLSKGQVFDKSIGSLHGIYYHFDHEDAEGFDKKLDKIDPDYHGEVGFSMDGYTWGKLGKDYRALEDTARIALNASPLYEVNSDFWRRENTDGSVNWEASIDWHGGAICGRAFRDWVDAQMA